MFVKESLVSRVMDRLDLAIDFATLGEYGLEPVGPESQGEVIPLRPRPSGPPTAPVGLPPAAECSPGRLHLPAKPADRRRPAPDKPVLSCRE